MSYRKLRIAFSVTCGIACVLLVVLWVRSYWIADIISFPVSRSNLITFGSAHGATAASTNKYRSGYFKGYWEIQNKTIVDPRIIDYHMQAHPAYRGAFGFGIINSPPGLTFCAPHWFLIVLALSFAVIPWSRRKWRFSVRTLLI